MEKERKVDSKLIQVEEEIYWVAKSILGSNEPSSGLWGMILVMLNQWWVFTDTKIQKPGKICISRKS